MNFKNDKPEEMLQPHIHTLYKLGPCPICGQSTWKNSTEIRNQSVCGFCGLCMLYPYNYDIEKANYDKIKEMGIIPYREQPDGIKNGGR